MLVRATKFAGTSLAIAGINATILNSGSMPSARPVFIDPAENRPLPARGARALEIEARLDQLNKALR